jgi:excisionase family DNA binding protein
MGELFTINEIAEKLKVTDQCIRDWIKEGKLKALKIGGVVRIEEEAYLLLLHNSNKNKEG